MIQVKSKELNGISRVSSEGTHQGLNTHMFLSVTSMSTDSFRAICNIIRIYDRILTYA